MHGKPSDNDELRVIWDEQKKLLKKGKVVWGALIQANQMLFRIDHYHAPGEVICSDDSHFDAYPDELRDLAKACGSLKFTQPDEATEAELARDITDEYVRSFGKPIPPRFLADWTTGQRVSRYTVFFQRNHLPEKVLCEGIFPLLTHPECESVMFLPCELWGAQMLEFWRLPPARREELQRDFNEREAEKKKLPLMRVTPAANRKLQEFSSEAGLAECIVKVWLVDDEFKMRSLDRTAITTTDQSVRDENITVVVSADDCDKIWGTELDWVSQGQTEGFKFNT